MQWHVRVLNQARAFVHVRACVQHKDLARKCIFVCGFGHHPLVCRCLFMLHRCVQARASAHVRVRVRVRVQASKRLACVRACACSGKHAHTFACVSERRQVRVCTSALHRQSLQGCMSVHKTLPVRVVHMRA